MRYARPIFLLLFLLTLGLPLMSHAAAPYIDPAIDTKHWGPADPSKTLFWTPAQQVAGYRNMEKISPARRISASTAPSILSEAPVGLSGVSFMHDGVEMTVDQYCAEGSVAGLIVLQNGTVVYERYGLGNDQTTRWASWSVAKSITSLLVGAAVHDGYIESIDEKVTAYLPRLKDSAYEGATIRNLLHMASGVEWNEDYVDPQSDVNSVPWGTLPLQRYLRNRGAAAEPGTVFNYNTAETNLVGTLLRAAIGNNLSTYLSEKIWQPVGMETDAYWTLTEPGGGEFGGCCLSITLRDYARIGLFALREGRLEDGTQVLPEGWMHNATQPSPAASEYGYLWWLRGDGSYRASGVFGQGISIHPQEDIVIVLNSARPNASTPEDSAWQEALFSALTNALTRAK